MMSTPRETATTDPHRLRFDRLLESMRGAPRTVALALLALLLGSGVAACIGGQSPNTGDANPTEDAREAGPKCPPVDVGRCGDGICNDNPTCGAAESAESCPQDCADTGYECSGRSCADTGTCGDGICNEPFEDSASCPRDCGRPDALGDTDTTSDVSDVADTRDALGDADATSDVSDVADTR